VPRSKPLTIALHVLWVAIIVAACALAILQHRSQPLILIPVLALAAVMLVLFVLSLIPPAPARKSAATSLGKLFTGLLILAAVAVLVTTLVTGYRNLGVTGVVVIAFFAFVFIRIFLDLLGDARQSQRKSPPEPPRPEPPDNVDQENPAP